MTAQEGRPDTFRWSSATNRRRACHPPLLLVIGDPRAGSGAVHAAGTDCIIHAEVNRSEEC